MRRFGVAILRTCRFQRTEGFGILEKKSALENVDLRQIVVKGIKREREIVVKMVIVVLVSNFQLGQNIFRVANNKSAVKSTMLHYTQSSTSIIILAEFTFLFSGANFVSRICHFSRVFK